jgi:hypothetical protein
MGRSNRPKRIEEPDSIYNMKPSWAFYLCDQGGRWAFTKDNIGDEFWDKIMPKLRDYEQQTWGNFSGPKKESHFVSIDKCNKCARDRLSKLKIEEQELYSLRISGKVRIYGLRPKDTLIILWYDNNHGDNDTCVCPCPKKGS